MTHPGLPADPWNQDGADDLSELLGIGFGTGAPALLLRGDDLIVVAANPRAERMLGGAGRSVPGGSLIEFAAAEGFARDVAALRHGGIDALHGERELITSSGDQRFGNEIEAQVTSELTFDPSAAVYKIAIPPPRECPNRPNLPVIQCLRRAKSSSSSRSSRSRVKVFSAKASASVNDSRSRPMPLPEKSNVSAVSRACASLCARYGKNAQCAKPLKPWQMTTVPSGDSAR